MNNSAQLHHIQKSIILSLARTSPLRFTELQPPRIANNTFSYHLKKLVDGGYIEVSSDGYMPTRKALKLVAFQTDTTKYQATPQTITMIYVKNQDGEVLLSNRNRKPFQGWYGIPGGLVHAGETLDQAVYRELLEKTGIQLTEGLSAAGVLDFRYIEKETHDIFMHVIGFVYTYIFPYDKQLLSDRVTPYGQLAWFKSGGDNILPEVFAVRDLVNAEEFTLKSVDFEEPRQRPVFRGAA